MIVGQRVAVGAPYVIVPVPVREIICRRTVERPSLEASAIIEPETVVKTVVDMITQRIAHGAAFACFRVFHH